MGVVYEALTASVNSGSPSNAPSLGIGRLLSPELEGALRVRHPNICMVNEIHTTTTDPGRLDFLTMEFLDGETLSAGFPAASWISHEALSFARQLCAGLAEAHRSGILHRDLKPANVILMFRKN